MPRGTPWRACCQCERAGRDGHDRGTVTTPRLQVSLTCKHCPLPSPKGPDADKVRFKVIPQEQQQDARSGQRLLASVTAWDMISSHLCRACIVIDRARAKAHWRSKSQMCSCVLYSVGCRAATVHTSFELLTSQPVPTVYHRTMISYPFLSLFTVVFCYWRLDYRVLQ